MNPFKNLSVQENEALLKFPAYISLLAGNSDSIMDEAEKKSAINFAHLKTLSHHPLLIDFYLDVDTTFKNNMEQLDKKLPKEKDRRETVIKKKLLHLEKIVLKLEKEYSLTMDYSVKSFKEHVIKAHNSVLVDFIFPLSIPGLTGS